jgi:hypothetical protein
MFALFFYDKNRPVLGSDGYYPLDKRQLRSKQIKEIESKIHSLRSVRPGIKHYQICVGDLRKYRTIFEGSIS